jgi:hypothetical protein
MDIFAYDLMRTLLKTGGKNDNHCSYQTKTRENAGFSFCDLTMYDCTLPHSFT